QLRRRNDGVEYMGPVAWAWGEVLKRPADSACRRGPKLPTGSVMACKLTGPAYTLFPFLWRQNVTSCVCSLNRLSIASLTESGVWRKADAWRPFCGSNWE